ncbi:MAG: MoxR family ATPase [bacterium]|nr:MoxR family ATPase [bacterium]
MATHGLPHSDAGKAFLGKYRTAVTEIHRDVVELDSVVEGLMIGVLAKGHVILEGEPGVGKTLVARVFNRTIDAKCTFKQFTPDMLPADLLYSMGGFAEGAEGGRTLRNMTLEKGPLFTKLLVADEINRAMPRSTGVLLGPMEEQCVELEGREHKLGPLYFVTATQNPVESAESTSALPEALRERFMLKILVPYPSIALMRKIAVHDTRQKEIQPCYTEEVLADMQNRIFEQYVLSLRDTDPVVDYLVRLILHIHDHPAVKWGPGIRAAQDLTQASAAHAFLHERERITFTDVKAMAERALAFKFELDWRQARKLGIKDNYDIIRRVLNSVSITGRKV